MIISRLQKILNPTFIKTKYLKANMSYNSWKFLNYLKDVLSKLTADKSVQADFFQLYNKIPLHDFGEYVRSAEKKMSLVQQSIQQIYNEAIKIENAAKNREEHQASWKKVKRVSRYQVGMIGTFS